MCVVGNHTISISTVCCALIGRPSNNRLERTRRAGPAVLVTALRSRARHERPHNKKEGRNDKGKDEQVSHSRDKGAVSQTRLQSQPTRSGRSRDGHDRGKHDPHSLVSESIPVPRNLP